MKSSLNLEKLVENEVDHYLTTRSLLFLEAACAALLDTRTPEQVAEILRQEADDLENWG